MMREFCRPPQIRINFMKHKLPHVIQQILNPRLWNEQAFDDVANNICQALQWERM